MFHPDRSHLGQGNRYWQKWRGFKEKDISQLSGLIRAHACSNCLWRYGVRKIANFAAADWLGLDFDDGLSLEQGVKIFKDYEHVIGVTKSHQVAKNGVIKDRYRVFLKFEQPCTSAADFSFTAKKWIDRYGADKACKDAARFFWPCKEIVSTNASGDRVAILDSSKAVAKAKQKTKMRYAHERKIMENSDDMLFYLQTKLDRGVAEGYRNITCYQIAKDFARLGLSEFEIKDKILNSAIVKGDFSADEALKAINSALK